MEAAVEVPPSIHLVDSSSILSFNPTAVQDVSGLVEPVSLVNE